jgi:hypothetical protein
VRSGGVINLLTIIVGVGFGLGIDTGVGIDAGWAVCKGGRRGERYGGMTRLIIGLGLG